MPIKYKNGLSASMVDIDEGVENVKRIIRDNYVGADEAQKIMSLLRESGSYTIIDRISVILLSEDII